MSALRLPEATGDPMPDPIPEDSCHLFLFPNRITSGFELPLLIDQMVDRIIAKPICMSLA